MVGPSREDATSHDDYRYLAAAFVALLALSGGSVALQGDASPAVALLAAVGGGLAGLALVAYMRWTLAG